MKIFHRVCELFFIFGMLISGDSQLFFVFGNFLLFFVGLGGMGNSGSGEVGGCFEELASLDI